MLLCRSDVMGMKRPGADVKAGALSPEQQAFIDRATNHEPPAAEEAEVASAAGRSRGGRKAPEEKLERVALLLPPAMIEAVDQEAEKAGIPRGVWIRLAVRSALAKEGRTLEW
jgi:hypothetical protein